jgi:CheY-like chemotaxis protein
MVNSSVDRLLVVVNEVLDFSRIETGELPIEAEDFNLKESLDHDLYLLSLAAQKKQLAFSCKVAAEVPAHVHGDATRLVQILTNLVNNAIKYTASGGVSIGIDNCGYDGTKRFRLRFTIADSGCGIAPEKLELINHYFRHRGSSTVALPLSIGTTGLGLTVSSQLVKLMDGEIRVESTSKGSVFSFELPFGEVADIHSLEEKTHATLENITESSTHALKGARVLLAEDEHINRTLIETILKQYGVVVTTVDNGKDAVREACSGVYQAVLMDVQMDGMDGLEATRAIRKYERKTGGHVDVVALTAQAMPGDREKCLQAGMDDYLAKPLDKVQLLEVLVKIFTRRALLVEGDANSQQLLLRLLVEAGWQVVLAETRRSAMYEASLSHFDLILLDVSTPSLESSRVAQLVRQLEDYSGRRAVILAIGDQREQNKVGAEGSFNGFLVRPPTKQQLARLFAEFDKP